MDKAKEKLKSKNISIIVMESIEGKAEYIYYSKIDEKILDIKENKNIFSDIIKKLYSCEVR